MIFKGYRGYNYPIMWAFYGWIFASFLIGLLGTMLFSWLSKKTGLFLDGSNGRKVHNGKVPRGAGIVFFIPFFIWALFDHNGYRSLIVPGTLLMVVGVLDDLVGMNAWVKLILQTVVAVITYYLGFKITALSFGGFSVSLAWPIALAFTVFFVVGMMNAFNLVDGIDGLAGSLAIIVFVILSYMASVAGTEIAKWGALMMAASVVGFLFLNSPPARVFMGDMGSHFLGYLIAIISIQVFKTDAGFLLIPAVILTAFPITDTFFAIIRRLRRRTHVFGADMNHLHHRLLSTTKNTSFAMFILLGVGLVTGVLSVVAALWPWISIPLGSAVFVGMFAWAVALKCL